MHKKNLLKIFVLLIAIVVIGFILFWLRPAKVVQDAFNKLAEADTQSFSATISVSNPQASVDILGEQASIELQVNGKFKREDDKRDSLDANVKLTTKTETVTMLIEANTMFLGEQAYFQITKAPPAFPALAQLKGQWIELPRGTQNEAGKQPSPGKAFLKIKSGDKQKIDGDTTKTYLVTATSEAVISMLDSIASILGTHLTAEQINNIKQGIANAKTLPVELAITPWTREIRQIKSTTIVPGSNNAMSIEFKFKDRNQPVNIQAPDNAQTLGNVAGTNTDTSGE